MNVLNTSRPRFWIYLFGPYIVGLAAGVTSSPDFLRLDAALFGLYFLLPANLLVYGVNDIYDFETDALNPKKAGYESLLQPESRRKLWMLIVAINLPFIIAAVLLAPHALPSLLLFVALSVFYSAPPIRAKAIPIIDSLFNILYVFPAAFAYQMITGSFPPFVVMVGAGFWTAAMHAYSAIPDIESDRNAGLDTIATALGARWTHAFCTVCFLVASFVVIAYTNPVMIMGLVYVGLMLVSVGAPHDRVMRIYSSFPFVNAITGFVLFWSIAWSKFF